MRRAILAALWLWLATAGAVGAAGPRVEPLEVDLWLRPDGGVDGELRQTWRAGDEAVPGMFKSIGHGARVLSVTDPATGRPYRYTVGQSAHESRVEVAFDPPLAPAESRAVLLSFDQTHVWHYDRPTRTLFLNLPWVQSWEVDVAGVVHRVHWPAELGAVPEPNGWERQDRALVARRAEGAARLLLQAHLDEATHDRWTAPLLARVPLAGWAGLAAAGGAGSRLHPAAAAALLAPGDDRALVEACLLALVRSGAIELRSSGDEPNDVEAVERPGAAGLAEPEARWLAALFDGATPDASGQRRVSLARAIERGVHRVWREEVSGQLAADGLLERAGAPGLAGLSYAGWAARERARRELAGRPAEPLGTKSMAAVSAAALAVGLGAGVLAVEPGRLELDSQQLVVGSIVVDGTPIVRLRYALARLLPLPASHGHGFGESCAGACGAGLFIGDHSCATGCGGVA